MNILNVTLHCTITFLLPTNFDLECPTSFGPIRRRRGGRVANLSHTILASITNCIPFPNLIYNQFAISPLNLYRVTSIGLQ